MKKINWSIKGVPRKISWYIRMGKLITQIRLLLPSATRKPNGIENITVRKKMLSVVPVAESIFGIR
jgi:hypothetical protein